MILPGLVDPESGVIRYMPHIAVENWGLVGALEKRFNVTCFVGHDIRSRRWPSTILARRIAKTPFWCACTAVPGGDYLQRAHFIGRNGNVGEIGHIQVDPLGERCHCGNFGCLETVAANAAIEQRVRHLLEQGYQSRLTPDDCTIKLSAKRPTRAMPWPAR